MSRAQKRQDQILAALREAPLDRVRLMKLFLVWHRSGHSADGPFTFEPYLSATSRNPGATDSGNPAIGGPF